MFPNPAGTGSLFFDNMTSPEGVDVAYDPGSRAFVTDAVFCANRALIGCNWTAPEEGAMCKSCAMTAMSPDPSMPDAVANWAQAETSKRWVLANLRTWEWFSPIDTGPDPIFHMLAEGEKPVVMGHAEGVVTISIEESDPVVRAERREALSERYRTMIGHMRHEIAHMLWWRLSIEPKFIKAFRKLFGDERADYGKALEKHYGDGAPEDWQERFLTSYASAHPHEDWAETTAHLLHLVDLTDSFLAAGLQSPDVPAQEWNPYYESDTQEMIGIAAGIAVGINQVNRSMGLQDLYPFVLSDISRKKLDFVHEWLRRGPNPVFSDAE
ncbi:zinc-binding metallopeptidase family protein [Chachezhania antarctica]|uniref:zinc-binding metallopeptidase family protein n=1 Tax=Chachezhania antarctica TaxID=2340860 RepID=UPI001F092F3D|nr:putative zinc-binding metallopeptidase [Chachezhania antarctica]